MHPKLAVSAGITFCLNSVPTDGAKHLMTPALYDHVGYDPMSDFTPVAIAGGGSFVLVVARGTGQYRSSVER